MDFNFDTGSIYGGLQTLDVSTLPPLGGQAGVLSIVGSGALTVPVGTQLQRPASPATGMFRFNDDTNLLEFYNGASWNPLSTSSSTVSSVAANSNSSGLTITGSPITGAGTFQFTLDDGLQALSVKTSTGIMVQTAADTYTSATITGTAGNITVSNGNAVAGNPTLDLAAVTQAASGNFVKITLDGFGRVTGNTSVVAADVTSLIDGTYVNVSGDTMNSGASLTFVGGGEVLGLPQTPSGDTAATSKYYVDSVAAGLSWKQAVVAATTTEITLSGTQSIDDIAVTAGQRVLVKNQTATVADNGIYVVATGAWVRSTDMDGTTPINEVNGAAVFVEQGTQADTAWIQINDVAVLGTDPIAFTQFAGMGSYTAGNGLTLTGNTFALSSPVSIANGGTALATAPANGQLLIGNGTSYTLSTLTDGTAISITEGAGAITITNTGVVSIAGTANQITASASTGAVTLSIPSAFIAPGSVQVTSTLTVDTLTANSALYTGAGGQIISTAALTDGQILIGDTGAAPAAGNISGGSGITVTNGPGSITIDIDNTEVVTSFSTGTTGLTPTSATTGAVTLGGTLAATNGGTGLSAIGTADQFLSVNSGATGFEYKTISAGTGISVTPGANVLTITNTGVTSVALSLPSIFSVSGSPVTTTGTLTGSFVVQPANTVFAGPATGLDATPTFRELVYGDIVGAGLALQLYAENAVTPSVPVASGANAVAIGPGSTASGNESFAVGAGSNARVAGMKAYANGSFATAGDAQHGVYVARGITSDGTADVELFLDGTSAQLVVPNNGLIMFDVLVAGRRTDSTGGGAGYKFVGVVKKDATSGSVTFVGTPSKTIVGETNTPWDATVSVDTATGAFRVRVTGETAKTIRWVATILTTEVTN